MLGFGGEGSNATPKSHGEWAPAGCPNFMAQRAELAESGTAKSLEASGASREPGAGARRRSGSRQGQEPEPKQERDPDIVGLFPPPAFRKCRHCFLARRLIAVGARRFTSMLGLTEIARARPKTCRKCRSRRLRVTLRGLRIRRCLPACDQPIGWRGAASIAPPDDKPSRLC